MGFHTPPFFILLVFAFCLYWSTRKYRLLVLAVFDCLFYLYAGLLDFGLLFGASVIGYLAGLGVRSRYRKSIAALGIGANVLNLAFFKYYYFVLGNIAKLVKVPPALSNLKVVLPIGISFYTFQLIAYIVDVHRGEIPRVQSFIEFWVFISFFGQVIAGPIMRAKDFGPQIANTESYRLTPSQLQRGLAWFAIGLIKKLVLADSLAPLVDKYFARGTAISSVDVWIAAYLFAFQIYYDFSAYSDMALGIGEFFGYNLTQNFVSPYISQNPSEFWKRWHITLSTWVRDYLYIPMGGSRKGFVRGLLAVILSMSISGLWHGASWTFVLWGLYHGLLSAGHRIWKTTVGKYVKGGTAIRIINTLGFLQLTMIGWMFFRVTTTSDLAVLLRKMLTFSDPSTGPHFLHYVLLIVFLYCLHLAEYLARKNGHELLTWWSTWIPALIRGLVYCAILLGVCVFLRPKPNNFIYFQF